MFRTSILLWSASVVLTAALASGCSRTPGWSHPASLEQVVRREFQPVIRGSTRVKAFLTSGDMLFGADSIKAAVRMPDGEGYGARSHAVFLSADRASRLRVVLLDRDSNQTKPKPCEFSPTVAYVFEAEQESVVVLICHSCDQMEMWSSSARSGGEVDPVSKELVTLAREIFPQDSLVHSVWERNMARGSDPHK